MIIVSLSYANEIDTKIKKLKKLKNQIAMTYMGFIKLELLRVGNIIIFSNNLCIVCFLGCLNA